MAENGSSIECPECGTEVEYNSTTTSSERRWKYTGTILALLTVASLPALIILAGLSVVALSPITQGWWLLYGTLVLMAATWTFGRETLQAVYEARGGN